MPHRFGSSLRIARGHDDPQSIGAQGVQGLERGVFDPIGYCHGTGQASVHRQEHDAGALLAKQFGRA